MGPAVLTLDFDGPVAVLGDLHGDLAKLDQLLPLLGDRPLLVLGDLCDRGPDSRGVLDRLLQRGARGVLGNHDEWLLALAEGRGFDSFALSPAMGGRATLASYGIEVGTPREVEGRRYSVPLEHREFLGSLATAIDLTVCGQHLWLVHAAPGEVPAGIPLEEAIPHLARTKPSALRWGGTAPGDVPALDRPLVMGHMCQAEPLDLGHVLAIDTGAGALPDGRLTALLLPERSFLSVP